MEFTWPDNLALLVIPLSLGIVYLLFLRRRQRYALRYASLGLIRQAVGRGPGIRRHIPPILFLFGFSSLVFALARPVALVSVPDFEGTVILAMDVSGSMLSDDVKPNRFEASKSAAKQFIERARAAKNNVRIGIVAFSDNAQVMIAPTLDHVALDNAIDGLRTQRSTAMGRGIVVAVDAIDEGADQPQNLDPDDLTTITPSLGPGRTPKPLSTPRPAGEFAPATIVLLTDGQNTQNPPPMDVVEAAVSRGIRIYTVGIGTPEGTVVTNEGLSARSQLDEETLQKVADATGGKYFNAQTSLELGSIYDNLASTLVLRKEKSEVTVLFAALAAAALLFADGLAMLWANRLP